jgi:hypothetical protein
MAKTTTNKNGLLDLTDVFGNFGVSQLIRMPATSRGDAEAKRKVVALI